MNFFIRIVILAIYYWSSAESALIHSFYPFISFHHPGVSVVHPHVHSASTSYIHNSAISGLSSSSISTNTVHHGNGNAPVEVITIPISVLRKLLLPDDKPIVLSLEPRNITLHRPSIKTNDTETFGLSPTVPEKIEQIQPQPQATVSPTNATETFGRRLLLSHDPLSAFKNGAPGSAK